MLHNRIWPAVFMATLFCVVIGAAKQAPDGRPENFDDQNCGDDIEGFTVLDLTGTYECIGHEYCYPIGNSSRSNDQRTEYTFSGYDVKHSGQNVEIVSTFVTHTKDTSYEDTYQRGYWAPQRFITELRCEGKLSGTVGNLHCINSITHEVEAGSWAEMKTANGWQKSYAPEAGQTSSSVESKLRIELCASGMIKAIAQVQGAGEVVSYMRRITRGPLLAAAGLDENEPTSDDERTSDSRDPDAGEEDLEAENEETSYEELVSEILAHAIPGKRAWPIGHPENMGIPIDYNSNGIFDYGDAIYIDRGDHYEMLWAGQVPGEVDYMSSFDEHGERGGHSYGGEVVMERMPAVPRGVNELQYYQALVEFYDCQMRAARAEVPDSELELMLSNITVGKQLSDYAEGILTGAAFDKLDLGQAANDISDGFGIGSNIVSGVNDISDMFTRRPDMQTMIDFYSGEGAFLLGPDEGLYGHHSSWTKKQIRTAAKLRAERVMDYIRAREQQARAFIKLQGCWN